MPRPPFINTSPNQRWSIAGVGDSLTFNHTLGVYPEQFWLNQLAIMLRTQNIAVPGVTGVTATPRVQARNFGRSGNTSLQMTDRVPELYYYDVPKIGFVWGGVNDVPGTIEYYAASTVLASPAPTTTTFTISGGNLLPFHTAEYIYVGGVRCTCTAISGTAFTVSGLNVKPVAGAAVTQGTQANLIYMIQQLLNAGVPNVMVLNTQYQLYSSGGDTTSTPATAYATLRPYQAAAVSSFSISNPGQVALCDLYAYMRLLIVNSTPVVYGGQSFVFADHSDAVPAPGYLAPSAYAWHVADSNQHLSCLGNYIVAQAVLAALLAQPVGWLQNLITP